jgi:hypothetical protein
MVRALCAMLATALMAGAARADGQCYGGAPVSGAAYPSYAPQAYYAPRYVYYTVPQVHPALGQSYAGAGGSELAKLRQALPLLMKMAELRSAMQRQRSGAKAPGCACGRCRCKEGGTASVPPEAEY